MTAEPAGSQPTPLSPEETSKLLALTKGADTVELKLTVPETRSGFRSTAAALEIDPLDAQIRQVFFFDTPDLLLNRQRCGRCGRGAAKGRVDDSVVKLRPVVPSEMPAELRKLPDFGVEVDALPGGFVCSASFKAKLDATDVRAMAARAKRPIAQAVHQGPDGVLRPARPGRHRAR